MQALEFKKSSTLFSKKYGISLVMAFDTQDGLLEEFKLAKEALLKWEEKRGPKGDFIQVTAATVEAMYVPFKEFISKVYHSEAMLSPILKSREFIIDIIDMDGNEIESFRM